MLQGPGGGGISLNEEQQEEFGKLQEQYSQQRKQMNHASALLMVSERDRNKASLTLGELDKMPEDTVMYTSVGKMFIMVPGTKVHGDLNSTIKNCSDRISELGTKRGAYEGAIKETEGKMQALMKRAFASETIAE